MSADAYRSTGVDLQAADNLKRRIQDMASTTYGPQVLSGIGGFAGLYKLDGFQRPVLVASTDGVGTKLRVASLMGSYESLGIDLVNLNVNDVITYGAKPLFFLDYLSMGKLDPQVVEPLLAGMSQACSSAGCALIGGESAQTPGLYASDSFDLAGTIVGAVEQEGIIDGSGVEEGDLLLGLPSSGLHTNGFSLVRKVFEIDEDPTVLSRHYETLGHGLGEELLVPHRCYYAMLEPLYADIKAMAHISGGGLVGNIPRVLPQGLAAQIRGDSWMPHAIFSLIQDVGSLSLDEMYQVFNMGIGMVLICGLKNIDILRDALPEAIEIGEVVRQQDDVRVAIRSS